MGPALSPNADRVIYARIENGPNGCRLWISAISGGSPCSLTNESAITEYPGSWSPDGNWFVYLAIRKGKADLMKVKTTGKAVPSLLKANQSALGIPSWSPAEDWIAYGQELISSDGSITRPLGNKGSIYYMFSADGKILYGLRPSATAMSCFSVDVPPVRRRCWRLGKGL